METNQRKQGVKLSVNSIERYQIMKINKKRNIFYLIYNVAISLIIIFVYNFVVALGHVKEDVVNKTNEFKQTIASLVEDLENVEDRVEDIEEKFIEQEIKITHVSVGIGYEFEDIKLALDSIIDNSYYNRYILDVMPGDYDYSNDENVPYLGLKNYVSIIGKDKGTCRIINKKSSTVYNENYSGVDPAYYKEAIEEASLENFTIITQGCKSPVHIDTDYEHFASGGKITINNCNLIDLNNGTMENFQDKGAGGVNVGLKSGQSVIVKNCNSNGAIYAHNWGNQNSETGCYFEIYNCRFKYSIIGDLCSNAPDQAVIHGSKFDYLCINLNPIGTDVGKYNWTIDLDGNQIGQIYGTQNEHLDDVNYLWDNYFGGKFAINDSSIHDYCYNSSNEVIKRGDFVKITNHTGSSPIFGTGVKATQQNDVYGVALEDIAVGDCGIIQYSGIIDITINLLVNVGDRLVFRDGEFEIDSSGNFMVLEDSNGLTDCIKVKFI